MTSDGTALRTGDAPVLRAVTRPLAELPDLLAHADPQTPLFWNRDDRGCVGVGEALRLVFRGPHRFSEASRAWRELSARAVVDDPVRMPGSGLVALGTFAFADDSGAESALVVPRLLVNRHRGLAWVTEVSIVGEEPRRSPVVDPAFSDPLVLPAGTRPGAWPGGELAPAAGSVEAYLEGVREATRRIAAGAVDKVVLSRQIEGRLDDGADLRVPLARLSERYLDCWTFAIDGLVGASPETLVRSTGGAVSARVLAGTRGRHLADPPRDRAARDELLRSAKEQHEHDFAVQSVVTALAPHVRELRTSEEPFALRLPNVWHLATDLGASLGDGATALELVDALHPTAAVAGTPTAAAVAAIAELEPFDRGRYAGAVGWIDAAGDGEWVIALRCAQLGPEANGSRSIVATAGGGIVEGSDPQHELGETVSKFRPIIEAFAGD